MTSSILSPLSQNLSGHDLQTLSDFALSAPYEWRKLFEALLVEVRTKSVDLEEAQVAQGTAEEALETVRDELDTATTDLRALKTAAVTLLGEVRTIQMELIGATTAQWQGELNQALMEFEGVVNDV